ncbi:MAG: M23 family metallopeptidase [Caulobacteraceae bacterium]|nr:M23 family metallopeptidase [Caulobacteraceae bacterium]
MLGPFSTRRPQLAARLLLTAAGVGLLLLGWRLTAEASAPASSPADVPPADYVPRDASPTWRLPATDPLLDVPTPARTLLGPPLEFLKVTSGFGLRRHPLLGFTRMHQGIDLAAPVGAPVLAAADGVVTEAAREGGYGNLLRLRHAGGWATGYAHLLTFAPGLSPGSRVLRGEVIGFVGETGLATGPHLHFEVSLDGVKLDPMRTPFGRAPVAQTPLAAPSPAPTASFLRLRHA